jgi:hypothetical protein
MKAPDRLFVEVCEDGIFAFEKPPFEESTEYVRVDKAMPDSTELIALWEETEAMLKEKDFRGDAWRLAYNAFLEGFAKGVQRRP